VPLLVVRDVSFLLTGVYFSLGGEVTISTSFLKWAGLFGKPVWIKTSGRISFGFGINWKNINSIMLFLYELGVTN
jgi:hypothetical protein